MAQRPAGIRWLHVHPMYLVDEDDLMVVRLAAMWRDGILPEPGGALAQPAATVASIRVVLAAWAELETEQYRKAEK